MLTQGRVTPAALCFFLFLGPALAERVYREQDALVAAEDDCNEDTCVTFRNVEAPCSCVKFLENDGLYLSLRAQEILYSMAQNLRYLTDYETTKTSLQNLWVFTKRKNFQILSASLSDFRFIQGAVKALPRFREFAARPPPLSPWPTDVVKKVRPAPAGAYPVMVEIWDDEVIGKNKFVGEAGLTLQLGVKTQDLPLQPNPSRSTQTAKMARTKSLGKVKVQTKWDYDASKTAPCKFAPEKACIQVALTVTCLSAENLVNVDSGILGDVTDPYCKVRVKEQPEKGSSKDATPAKQNNLNPKWTEGNSFTYTWQAVAVDLPGGQGRVPWTLDRMPLLDQFRANLRLLVKGTVLKGTNCKDSAQEKTKQQVRMCKLLEEEDPKRPDAKTIAEIKASGKLSDEDEQTVDAMAEEAQVTASAHSLLESRGRRSGYDDYDYYDDPDCDEDDVDDVDDECAGAAVAFVLGILMFLIMLFLVGAAR